MNGVVLPMNMKIPIEPGVLERNDLEGWHDMRLTLKQVILLKEASASIDSCTIADRIRHFPRRAGIIRGISGKLELVQTLTVTKKK